VSFGDGLTGQLVPTGSANVYLRTTQIGPAQDFLANRRAVRIVEQRLAAVPFRVAHAAAENLQLTLECAVPEDLSGPSELGAAQWRPVLELLVTMPGAPRTVVSFTEISHDEAAGGKHGFLLSSTPDLPPGLVVVSLYAATELAATTHVEAWLVPGAQRWVLDRPFYQAMGDADLTAVPGAAALPLLSTSGLRAGSALAMFADPTSPPDIVRVTSIDPPTWSAVIDPPLPRVYDLERSFIRGNVAPIVQGAVERITIGGSDGGTPSLRLPLQNREPLLYVVAAGEAQPDVTVLVSDQPWQRVLDFTSRTPTSRVWRLDVAPDGSAFVLFGDGKQGAIPPAGRDHITATVRLGSGAAGNLPAGSINKLVAGNLAIKSTANLTASAGGSAGDSPAVARDKAFARKLPSERVVSTGDCVRAAIGESGVIAAALDPTAPPGTLGLVVAMEDRRDPTAEDLAAVHAQVTGVMPVTASVRLQVAAAAQRAVHLVIELGVAEGFLTADVFLAVAAALGAGAGGMFAADQWDIGEPLRLGALYDALFKVDGVGHARVVWMANTPLLQGEAAPGPAPDVFDPGATGVVRCDNDPAGDPFGRRGTFRLQEPDPPKPVSA
jgi:hypothetical protein